MRRIAKALAAPLSTIGRWLKSMGLGRLRNLQPKEPVPRYQWAQPGDMIHVDTNSWRALSGWATTLRAIGAWAARLVLAMRRRTWPWMTPLDWPTSRSYPMSKRPRRWASWCGLWPGSTARASPAAGCYQTTAVPTAPSSGVRPAVQWA